MAQELISVSQINAHLIKDYLAGTEKWSKALVVPGQDIVSVELASLSKVEADLILMKLDMIAMKRQNSGIAAMLAEEADSILTAVRMVKTNTKEAFRGILGAGAALDICWLRAKDVGGELTDQDGQALKGAYANGAGGAVYPWTKSFTAGTSVDMFPAATTIEEAGIVLLGFIEPLTVTKVEAVQITISGIPCPPQSLTFKVNEDFGSPGRLPFCRLEKPVIIGPEKLFQVAVNPYLTGNSECMPLALLITTAEKMSLT